MKRLLLIMGLVLGLLQNGYAADAPGERDTLILAKPSATEAVVGTETRVHTRQQETLADIAVRHALGYRELVSANPDIDPWLPDKGKAVLLPQRYILPDAPRRGIVLNIPEMRLYYYPQSEPQSVWTFPVGVGRQGWQTPTGVTEVVRKAQDPSWYPPESIQEERRASGLEPLPARVPPGPGNPLGRHALYLDLPAYLFHGTDQPFGIGMPVSHGCIRLHPDDIHRLFEAVPVGTPVHIVHQPVKVGWHEGALYLEAHPPLFEEDSWPSQHASAMVRAIIEATRAVSGYTIDWDRAHAVLRAADGRPHPVGGMGQGEVAAQ